MSNDKMRAEFERAFPVPEGIYWNTAFDLYIANEASEIHALDSVRYRARWEGWKAALESIVIHLPESLGAAADPDTGKITGAVYDPRALWAAIDSAGIKRSNS